jgi:TP901 family phage tail tape measure protein
VADRTVKVILDATISGLQSKMKAAKGSVQDFSSNTSQWLTKNEGNLDKVASSSMKMGAVLTGAFGLAVKSSADFESAMSGVQAATMETSSNMGVLREAILQAGADTQYSATEAADAVTALSKAGVSTQDILNGGLAGALNLAAAGELDVGDAAEIAATSMNQFGLKGQDVSHIADLLAAGAGKAMGEVTDMAGAMKFVGPVASQMGVSIEETAGTIAYLAQQGVLGEQAGTSLRGMLSSLTSPSKIASKTMEELGINVYDASGKFVGFRGVAEQLQDSMSGLTNAERDQALGRIFGNEQITTARILYQGGASAVDEWTAAVDDSGYAAEQAAIRTDNLKGDVERLGGSLETALIKGGTGANNALRGLVQGADAVVDAIGNIPEPVLNATTMIVGAGGLVALGAGGLSKLAVFVNNTKLAFEGLGVSAKAASVSVGLVGGALAIGGLALGAWMQHMAEAKAQTDAYKTSLDDATGAITDNTRETAAHELEQQGMLKTAQDMGLKLSTVVDAVLGERDAIDEVNAASERYLATGRRTSAGAGQGAASQNTHADAVNRLKGAIDGQNDSLNQAIEAKQREASAAEETGEAEDGMGSSVDAATGLVEEQTDALTENLDALNALAQINMTVDEAQGAWQQQIDDNAEALKKLNGYTDEAGQWVDGLGRAVNDSADAWDLNSEAGRLANDTMLDTSKKAWDVINALNEQDASTAELRGATAQMRDEFIQTATQMGMSQQAAETLADKYGLIPSEVTTRINANDADARQKIADIQAKMNQLNGSTATFYMRGVVTGASSVREAANALIGGGAGLAGGGAVSGPGTGTSDSVGPFWLSNGEYVVREQAASRHRALLDAINYGGGIGMAGGGSVGTVPQSMLSPSVSVAAPVVSMPSTLVVVDADGALVGRMRVEADRAVYEWDRA